jgi:hypothetical protein
MKTRDTHPNTVGLLWGDVGACLKISVLVVVLAAVLTEVLEAKCSGLKEHFSCLPRY